MPAPARFTKVTNAPKNTTLHNLGQLDPTEYISYFNDFFEYNASDWTITTVELGLSSATEALTNVAGGCLLITNDGADNDADFFQLATEPFLMVAGKEAFFKCRFKVSDATQSDVVFGLQITDTSPLDVTDGIFFQKDDGDANVDFHVEKNNSATTSTAVTTMADDTFIVLGWHYNGSDEITVYADDVKVATVATTNLPDDEELAVSFGIQNGEAAAKTMTVDYIFAAVER